MKEWRWISGYEGKFSVSSDGEVASFMKYATGKLLRPGNAEKDHPSVVLLKKKRYVHQLVAETFLGPRPEGAVIRHLDGNKYNSAVSNLAYASKALNEQDKVYHGGTKVSVEAIRSIRRCDWTLAKIAEHFKISIAHAHEIKTRKKYGYVKD